MSLDFVRTANKLDGPPDTRSGTSCVAAKAVHQRLGCCILNYVPVSVASKGKESVVVDNQWCIFREA